MPLEIRALSSLDKLFPDETPTACVPFTEGFRNEVISWQLALRLTDGRMPCSLTVSVDSPLNSYTEILQVRHVPVRLATYSDADDRYLRKQPGLYPDLLARPHAHSIHAFPDHWECVWLTVNAQGAVPAGTYPVTVRFHETGGTLLGEHTQSVTLLPGLLPDQQLWHTRWFHADCLAQFYHVPVFSEEHWQIMENFVRSAADCGVNMLLMPVHTPPLDTRPGSERLPVQLTDIRLEDGEYRFDMTRVHRWIRMCLDCGIRTFEIAHLFTQWGAEHAPNIYATTGGRTVRIFGWETDAGGEAYRAFLQAYIPALRTVFREEGIEDRVWWHISDEPSRDQLPVYLHARNQVLDLLSGAQIMDALSNFDFYSQGVVRHPVVASNALGPFLAHHVPDLWMYVCCSQYRDVANQFMAMPSARCRILGAQMFRYHIRGFLHWGFNFYNSQYSDYPIDPYACTDADGAFPAGDPFLVYPGHDGRPEASIRYMVFREAMQDLRALEWLASLAGHETADACLGSMTLTEYPHDPESLIRLRQNINGRILEYTGLA